MSDKPTKSARFKLKLFTGIFFALAAVSAVALLSYNSVSKLVNALHEEAKPNRKLILLNEIMSDLSSAESSVRTYTITHNAAFLAPYQYAVASIEDKLEQLSSMNKDAGQIERLDSISALISKKYSVFNELILLRQDDRVEDVLNKIIKKLNVREEKSVTEVQQEKISKLKELFRSKKEKEPEKPPVPQKNEIDDLQKMVTRLKREEFEKTETSRNRELELTIKDVEIMHEIRMKIDEYSSFEISLSKIRAEKAEKLADTATAIITVIAISAFILVLSLAFLVVSFVNRTIRYNKELKESKIQTEKLAQAKEEFLATMSHEIRTPMNAILGFSEQLEKTRLDTRQQLYTATMKDSIEHLLVVVNDILDFSKIESGKFSFEKTGFMPVEIINGVTESFRKIAQEKNLSLRFEADESLPDILVGDPHRLKQILYNLIGNAVKFTEEGEVSIKAHSTLRSENFTELKVEVADTGIGIPAEKIKHIFENFYQSDSSTTRKYGGTGLGLGITKKLVELQKGTLQVKSKPGDGSVFTFTIPYSIGTEINLENHPTLPADPSGLFDNISALIVDDEDYNRLLLETILNRWGIKVQACENGKEALEAIEKNNFQIVLMDVRMPEMNGLEATKIIRQKKDTAKSQVPVLALTAGSSEEDIRQCKAAGMNDFLTKPFREIELFEKICSLLRIEYNLLHQKNTTGSHSEASNTEKIFDLTELKRLGDGDENFVNDMLKVFIENTHDGMKKMKEAIENNDWDKAGMQAHRLAAPHRHLGMKAIVKILKTIERDSQITEKQETIPELYATLKNEVTPALELLQKEIKA